MNRFGVVAAALVAACSGGSPRPAPGEDAPGWLSEGTGAVVAESGRRLQGVGAVSGIRDPKARRRQADLKAREQVGQAMDALVQKLAQMSEVTKAGLAGEMGTIAKSALPVSTQIMDHWVTADGTETSLSVVEIAAFKQALQNTSGDERVKRDMAAHVDRAFDQLARTR